jgi:glycosyltransferase involved in cell wall biosynthesis
MNLALCKELAKSEGVELQVLTTDANGPYRRIDANELAHVPERQFEIKYCRRNFYPDVSLGLLARLPQMILRADLVHLHGVYCFSTMPTLILCALMRKPVVWSASGALQRSSERKRHTKTLFDKLCNVFSARNRVVVHYATEVEAAESNARLLNVSSVVIPFGATIPTSTSERTSHPAPLRLLYVGRLHPIKGIENLLRALALTKSDLSLTICGAGETTYEASLRTLVTELALGERVRFLGEVSGDVKEDQFRQADLCVVPSFKESFGAVVTESLARAVPVIASDGTPWPAIDEVGCGVWIRNSPESLAQAIDQAATWPLQAMGNRGREWMRREFSWDRTAARFIDTYHNLVKLYGRNKIGIAADASASLTAVKPDA